MKTLSAILTLMIITVGCTVGPNYKRPTVDVPGGYRGAAPTQQAPQVAGEQNQQASAQSATSLGEEKWWEVFQDKQLQELIQTALKNNYDVNIAAARILKAQAQLGITRADQLPTLSAGAAAINADIPRTALTPNTDTSFNVAAVSLNWQLDFWGKYRRATEAARANLLATRWAREYVVSTLVSNVAASYFELRALDLQLEISRRTLAAREESLKLTQTLSDGGRGTMLDVRQAEQLVATAAENIPDLERRIEQQENYISTLMGDNPGPITRGLPLTEQPHAPEVPAGLPSDLLERRPDIRQAEHFPDRQCRIRQLSVDQPVHRTRRTVGIRRHADAAHLYWRKNQIRCQVQRSATAGNAAELSANHSAGVSRGFGLAGCLSQGPRVPRLSAATRRCRARCSTSFRGTLCRWSCQLLGSAD